MTEQELAAYVIEWLEKEGWTVYQEVSTGALQPVADIVALKNGLTWIVECKISYGLKVLDQACRWIAYNSANFISIAVKQTKQNKGQASWYFHKDKGVGLIRVEPGGYIYTTHKPKLYRVRKLYNIKNILREEHKHFAKAGAADGGYFTKFRQTVREVLRYIENNPGTTVKEMIDNSGKFHYSNPQSAKGSIAKYIRSGVIDGIRVVCDGRKHRLYIK